MARYFEKPIVLSISSGILFSLSWLGGYWSLLIFMALVPLLVAENRLAGQKDYLSRLALYSLLTFLIWNSLTIWWLAYATVGGAIFAILGNSVLMSFVFFIYGWSRKKTGFSYGPWLLVIWWLAFEHVYLRTEISFPWLNFGNVLATLPHIIQWYELTGVGGGSLLILCTNILLFQFIQYRTQNPRRAWVALSFAIVALAFAFGWSLWRYSTYSDSGRPVEVVVVQPNIDPYNEKFSGLTDFQQLEKFLKLANTKISPQTEILVGPETALTEYIWENRFNESMSATVLRQFLSNFPTMAVLMGASTRKYYLPGEEIPPTAIRFRDTALYYDRFNTAILLDSASIQIHHKSKLVLGVEKMPYPQYLKFLESLSIDLGGTVGSLGYQDTPTVFTYKDIKPAPVICYESVYGDYVAEYVRKGANMIAVITNDGWWDDTPGYKQHLKMAQLRAIETRRSVARSANTGISCFINQRGDILSPTKWWTPDVITGFILLNEHTTFYVKHGDFIGRTISYFALLVLIYLAVLSFVKNRSVHL